MIKYSDLAGATKFKSFKDFFKNEKKILTTILKPLQESIRPKNAVKIAESVYDRNRR